jgi:hypothetical protein
MYARWGSFAVGLGLVLAPLIVGYGAAVPILHHVVVGSLVCIAALAALEWPLARFALALPAVWLLASSRSTTDAAAASVGLASGALLLALTLVPSAPYLRSRSRLRRVEGPGRGAGVRA